MIWQVNINNWQVNIKIWQVNIKIWQVDIIHISHGFEGDIPEYQPRGDTKALARYVTRCRSYINYICDITWKLIQKCYTIIWQVMAEICHHMLHVILGRLFSLVFQGNMFRGLYRVRYLWFDWIAACLCLARLLLKFFIWNNYLVNFI